MRISPINNTNNLYTKYNRISTPQFGHIKHSLTSPSRFKHIYGLLGSAMVAAILTLTSCVKDKYKYDDYAAGEAYNNPAELMTQLNAVADKTLKNINDTTILEKYGRDEMMLPKDKRIDTDNFLKVLQNKAEAANPEIITGYEEKTILGFNSILKSQAPTKHKYPIKVHKYKSVCPVIIKDKIYSDNITTYVPVEYYGSIK